MVQKTVLSLLLALSFTLPSYSKPTILDFRHDQPTDTREVKKGGFIKSIRTKMNEVANWISENQLLSTTIALLVIIPAGVAAWYGKKLFKKSDASLLKPNDHLKPNRGGQTPVDPAPVAPSSTDDQNTHGGSMVPSSEHDDEMMVVHKTYSRATTPVQPNADTTTPAASNAVHPTATSSTATSSNDTPSTSSISAANSAPSAAQPAEGVGELPSENKRTVYSNPKIEAELTLWEKATQETLVPKAASIPTPDATVTAASEPTSDAASSKSSKPEVTQATIVSVSSTEPTSVVTMIPNDHVSPTDPDTQSKDVVTKDASRIITTNDTNPAAQPAKERKPIEETKKESLSDSNLHNGASSSNDASSEIPCTPPLVGEKIERAGGEVQTTASMTPAGTSQPKVSLHYDSPLTKPSDATPTETLGTPVTKRKNPYAKDDTLVGKGLAWLWGAINDDENE